MLDKIFFASIFAFLAGVFVRSFYTPPEFLLILLASLSALSILAYIFARKNFFVFVFFALSFILLGVFRFHYADVRQPKNIFDHLVGENISFEGFVAEEPDRRENNQRLIIKFENVKILVTTDLYPEFSYGDKLAVSGKLQKPQNFITDVGKDFNYINYLAKDGIFYNVSFAKVTFLESGHGSGVKRFLLENKKRFLNKTEELIPDPGSSLLGGLLLGTKQSLGRNLEQSFIDTGLIHIVVLSGYNVTIIAEAILRALAFLPLLSGIFVGSFAILLFAITTGAGATIVRASIMAILALVARATGHAYDITRALIFSGFLMVLHNPYILYFDISFQLSFLATLGLIYLSPIVKKYFTWLPNFLGLQDIASATVAVQIFVLPFILYKMGTLSIIAPITNLLVLPLIPATMLFGFLTGIIGFVSGAMATPFAWVSHLLLSLEIGIVKFFGDMSFSAISIRHFSIAWVLIIYIIIFFIIYKNYKIIDNESR
jgi:competence protein ComEC